MKIRINKIFGKYDNEIDLDKNINIFIGENGIGKSTTIKILNKLFKYDYKGLLNYFFDSIDIIDDDETISIEYSDLMLTNEALITDFLGDEYFLYKKIKKEFEIQKKKKSFRDAEKIVGRHIDVDDFESWMLREVNDELYTEMVNANLRFTDYYYYDLFLSKIDNRLLYKILKFDNNILRNEPLIKEFKNSLKYINMIHETYSDYTRMYDEKKYLNNTTYNLMSQKISRFIKKMNFNDVLFVDMVSHFSIINDLNRLAVVNDLEHSESLYNDNNNGKLDDPFSFDDIELLDEPDKLDDTLSLSDNTELLDEPDKLDNTLSLFDNTEYLTESHLKKYKDMEYCNKLKENHQIIYNDDYPDDLFTDIVNYASKPGVSDEFINELYQFLNNYNQPRDKNIIDFGFLLYNYIYNNEKINEFKNDFYGYLNEFSNTISPNNYNISNKEYNKIKYYLRPLLNSDNVIAKALDKIFTLNDSARYLYKEELNFLWAFYHKFKDKYFDINDEVLNLLNSLFKLYFTNKEVIATPFGISISTKDYENDINFEELSTGERKIIILFMLLVFSKNQIILLDEPESSLSIVWQEQLLKDIIDKFDFNRMIVATQSPYIIESEDLDEYIIPLIDGEENE